LTVRGGLRRVLDEGKVRLVMRANIGVIGGTGLGEVLAKRGGKAVSVDTPFGPPSSDPVLGEWAGERVAFLSRHGPGHTLGPANVPYRANIWALKKLGVSAIIGSGAVGSLRDPIEPGHLVICDQVIDKTFRRPGTFFDEGLVAHVELADPFCPRLREALMAAADQAEAKVHSHGTYICMEGPQFSTRAESQAHRQSGGDLVGMTLMPEAKLAREAEICYAAVALVTDYDCWRPHDDPDNADSVLTSVIANLNRAAESATRLVGSALGKLPDIKTSCGCGEALKLGIWSDLQAVDEAVLKRFEPLIGKRGHSTFP
jgi:5'-methylthioadenosine phosphorylase